VSGQRAFARNNIEYVMTIKKDMKTSSTATSVKVVLDPSDTIDDVYRKLNTEIAKVKEAGEATKTDDTAAAFMKLPRLLLKFVIGVLKLLDYFGKLPMAIINASPFHGSFIISDIGSIGLPVIYHHLYNFGNMPVFISIGAKKKAYEIDKDGAVVQRKYVDYTMVADERICDGFYFSQAFKVFRSVLRNPRVLDAPPETVVEDID
jgi:hypothetical protein